MKRSCCIAPSISCLRTQWTCASSLFSSAGLEGIMAKRADSAYASGSRTPDWLKIKTAKRQEVVIAGFTAPRRTRPFFGALVLAVREGDAWRYIGHVGTGFSHKVLEDLHAKLLKLTASKSPFPAKVKARPSRPGSGPRWLPRSNSRSGRARANCASPSTSGSGPTSARRMSCVSENVRANSSDPLALTGKGNPFALYARGRALIWPAPRSTEGAMHRQSTKISWTARPKSHPPSPANPRRLRP